MTKYKRDRRWHEEDGNTWWFILDDPKGKGYGLGSRLGLWRKDSASEEWWLDAATIEFNGEYLFDYDDDTPIGGPYTFTDGKQRVTEIVAILERGAK